MSEEIAVVETPAPAPAAAVEAPAPAVEAPSEPRSLDDTLAATMAEIKARRPAQGEDGKFIPKAGAETATPKVEVPGSPQAAAPEPAMPAIAAPQSLPATLSDKWATAPREVQEWIANREAEAHKKITSDGERLKSYEAFDEALAPSRDFIEQHKIPRAEYVRRLAVADHALRTQGPAALAEIARMYGIAVPQSIGHAQQGQPMDPQYSALAQELGAIKSQLTQQQEAERNARLAESEKKIEAFKKNAPHFDKVEPLMTKLYEPGMDLETLYEMAAKAHPEVSKLLAEEAAAKAKAEETERLKKEQADAAKLATLSRKPGSVGTAVKPAGSWEDTMRAQHRAIKARA